MDALISLVYTIIDSVCVCLFLDAFASHRWRDHRFLVGVIVQTILMYASFCHLYRTVDTLQWHYPRGLIEALLYQRHQMEDLIDHSLLQ